MTEAAQFEPIYPAHAIERCGTAFIFNEPLTDKIYSRARAKADAIFSGEGLISQTNIGSVGFQIDAQRGLMTPLQSSIAAGNYKSRDGSISCSINPTMIIFNTTRYVRWQPFIGHLERLVLPLLNIYDDAVSLASLQLDYLDRFFWNGNWSDFSINALVDKESKVIGEYVTKSQREWHSHIGWFDNIDETERRLTQVNVDVVGASKPGEAEVFPSVGIYTMMQDQLIVAEGGGTEGSVANLSNPLDRLEKLHTDLKNLFGKLIVREMAERIALNA